MFCSSTTLTQLSSSLIYLDAAGIQKAFELEFMIGDHVCVKVGYRYYHAHGLTPKFPFGAVELPISFKIVFMFFLNDNDTCRPRPKLHQLRLLQPPRRAADGGRDWWRNLHLGKS